MRNLEFTFTKPFPEKTVRAAGILAFAPGTLVHALMGDSGSGKTTFARWVAGLEPAEGSLSFEGESWQGKGGVRAPQSRRVALLAQGDTLFPHLSVEKNVQFGLRTWPAEARRERGARLLELVGLQDAVGRNPRTLSGGEKRRAALAQALAPNPRLLILDEPFTGLHEEATRELTASLKTWIEAAALPTVLITHDEKEARALGAILRKFNP